jgi:hypothetical protein
MNPAHVASHLMAKNSFGLEKLTQDKSGPCDHPADCKTFIWFGKTDSQHIPVET